MRLVISYRLFDAENDSSLKNYLSRHNFEKYKIKLALKAYFNVFYHILEQKFNQNVTEFVLSDF